MTSHKRLESLLRQQGLSLHCEQPLIELAGLLQEDWSTADLIDPCFRARIDRMPIALIHLAVSTRLREVEQLKSALEHFLQALSELAAREGAGHISQQQMQDWSKDWKLRLGARLRQVEAILPPGSYCS